MPAVKTKAVSLQGFQGTNIKKSTHGRAFKTTGGKSEKGRKVVIHSFTDEIEKVTAKIGEQLKGQFPKLDPRKGRQIIAFNVIIDGESIRVVTPTISRAGIKPAAQVKPAKFDPHAAGRKVVQEMQEAEGGAWTGAELLNAFGLTSANLHKRRSEYRIVAWRDAKNQFHYPMWQFNHAGAVLPGVQEALQTFRSSDEWRVMRYFLAPRHQLDDRTPLDLLRAGEVDKAVAHAKAHAEENSW